MRNSSSILVAGLLTGLLCSSGASAQALYNQGSTITVGAGATLSVIGGYQQTSGATLKTDGTTLVTGDVQSASGATLDLGAGELSATGHVTNAGTTQASSTGTLRLTGAANQNLDVAGGTVGRLIVTKSTASQDTVRVVSDVNIINQLQLIDGMVRTRPTSAARLANGAVVSGETAGQYVQGHLVVSRNAVNGITPVDFGNGATLNPGGNSLGTVSVDRAAGLKIDNVTYGLHPTDATKSIDRIWTITPQTQPAANQPATLAMTWLADDDNGLTAGDFAQAVAFTRLSSAAPWVQNGAFQNAQARSLATPATTLADWTVFADNVVLPVELLTFTATRAGDAARLRWATASEKNSAYFEVEVSRDGLAYTPVGRVTATGTSYSRRAYELLDPRLLAYRTDFVYYRLRQVDRDGATSVTDPQTLRVGGERVPLTAAAWPNPATGTVAVQLQVRTGADLPLELSLIDATGRQVQQRTLAVEAGTSLVPLAEITALPVGFYVLHVRQGTEHVALRVVRQ
ncbi:MAG: T9SS type A sorting domain-containing protein [Hymenobacteraceae bacterium]|nr:T9SS type A sorting domain-containing protein [Hymenobacteraceae bacterium]